MCIRDRRRFTCGKYSHVRDALVWNWVFSGLHEGDNLQSQLHHSQYIPEEDNNVIAHLMHKYQQIWTQVALLHLVTSQASIQYLILWSLIIDLRGQCNMFSVASLQGSPMAYYGTPV